MPALIFKQVRADGHGEAGDMASVGGKVATFSKIGREWSYFIFI